MTKNIEEMNNFILNNFKEDFEKSKSKNITSNLEKLKENSQTRKDIMQIREKIERHC